MANDGQDAQHAQDDELTTPGALSDDDSNTGDDEAANNPGKQDESDTDEPATAAQKSYISRMAVDVGQEVPFELTKAEADDKIKELEVITGRDATPELA